MFPGALNAKFLNVFNYLSYLKVMICSVQTVIIANAQRNPSQGSLI